MKGKTKDFIEDTLLNLGELAMYILLGTFMVLRHIAFEWGLPGLIAVAIVIVICSIASVQTIEEIIFDYKRFKELD